MKSHSLRLKVESLDSRIVPSTVAYGDFNNDGLMDKAAITAPTTITVSLANANGSYTVSATLTTPQNRPMQNVNVYDSDADGDLDVVATGTGANNNFYIHTWPGQGNGTFGSRHTEQWHFPHHGGWI